VAPHPQGHRRRDAYDERQRLALGATQASELAAQVKEHDTVLEPHRVVVCRRGSSATPIGTRRVNGARISAYFLRRWALAHAVS